MKSYIYDILWLFVLLASFCSCRKEASGLDEELVPIKIAAVSDKDAASKATVDRWEDDVISVFGVKREKKEGYDFTDKANIVDYKAVLSGGNLTSSVPVYSDETSAVPYYYQEGCVYDFFGYHTGGALVREMNLGYDECSVDVEISGSDDLMYAYTDLQKDMEDSEKADLTLGDLYSARAARRGVHPTLIFNHVLSRFIFIVKGDGEKYDMLDIMSLEVKARTSGRLIFKGDDPGYVVDPEAEEVSVSLKDAEDRKLEIQSVVKNTGSIPLGGEGASIMIPSGEDSLKVSLKCRIKDNLKTVEYNFALASRNFVTQSAVSDVFLPGYSYKVFITVYGPEEIRIHGMLLDWQHAGDFDIDTDDDENGIVVRPDDDIDFNGTHVGDYDDGGYLGDVND